MNARQREPEGKYLSEKRSSLTDPIINCLECEHHDRFQCWDGTVLHGCEHPRAGTLRGAVLSRSIGGECLDIINAPKECMLRKPCSPECKKNVLDPCETCGRAWGE